MLIMGMYRMDIRVCYLNNVGKFSDRNQIFWENLSTVSGRTMDLKDLSLQLPSGTLILGEFVEEMFSESEKQRVKRKALHIIDAISLGSEFVGDKPYDIRMIRAAKFVRALTQFSRDDQPACVVRTKKVLKAISLPEEVNE